jgi:NAD(P)-dependent dehydrogenase (short-subunit alcohol dehydrogenase family)
VAALVTGAASGMGGATVQVLLAAGAEVHAVDLAPVDAPVAAAYRCDLSDPGALAAFLDRLPPGLDAAYLCAGLPQTHSSDRVVAVNLLANRVVIEWLGSTMHPGGAIAVVSSVTYGWERMVPRVRPLLDTASYEEGLTWWRQHGADQGDPYVFSKYALTAYCVAAAVDLATRPIRLNVLAPGNTDTPMFPAFEQALGTGRLDAMPCPLARRSSAREQADALRFLNDPVNGYLTGAVLYNDGGMSAALALASSRRERVPR